MTINFRTMLHKIHMGEELSNASTYTIVGHNGNASTFEEIVFPVMPGQAKSCATCHGAGNTAWKEPAVRAHASQTTPTRNWMAACNSCHDSTDATTHIAAMTTASGAESCVTCHGAGQVFGVDTVHKNR